MRRLVCAHAIVALVVLAAAPLCLAQNAAPRPEPALRDSLATEWIQITDKLTTMAEDFPEAKYDFQPVPGVRTFADQLRHAAFWNMYVAKQMKGEKIDLASTSCRRRSI